MEDPSHKALKLWLDSCQKVDPCRDGGRISAKFSDLSLWRCGSGWLCHFFLALQSDVGSPLLAALGLRTGTSGQGPQASPLSPGISPFHPALCKHSPVFLFLLDNVALIPQSKWSFISVQWSARWWLIVICQWCFNSLLAKSRHSFYIPSSVVLSHISNFKHCYPLVFHSQAGMSFSFCCLNEHLIYCFWWKSYIPHDARFCFISYLIPHRLKLWQRPSLCLRKNQRCNVQLEIKSESRRMGVDAGGGWDSIKRCQQRLWAFAHSQVLALTVTELPRKHNGHLWAS